MTLGDEKKKVLSLIEEVNPDSEYLTDDPDIQAKINYVINQVQYELARMKKIPTKTTRTVTENEELDLSTLDQFYQLDIIRCKDSLGNEAEVEERNNFATFKTDGTATIYYFKYPTRIDAKTPDTYEFELSDDTLEILPYGVAGDLLKSDVSNSYGQIYSNRYEAMLQRLDSRYNTGSIYIESMGTEVI